MTSNIGSHHLLEGVTENGQITTDARAAVERELRAHFRPEFLNRVDDIVLFKPLQRSEVERIVGLLADELGDRLEKRGFQMHVTDDARAHIASEAYDPVYGARPLKRFIQHEIESKIARLIVSDGVAEGGVIRVGVGAQGTLEVCAQEPCEVAEGKKVGAK